MELQLINQELAESKLFKFTGSFSRLSGREIADLFYLQTLATFMFTQDSKQRDYGLAYAYKTIQYGPFAVFRTAATDLYMLAFAVNQSDYPQIKIKNADRKFLKTLSFQNRKYYQFITRLSKDNVSISDATTFLFRLESQLKISNPIYKQMRRLICQWPQLKFSQRQAVISKMVQQLRVKGTGSEVFRHASSMQLRRELKPVPQKSNTLKRAAATAVGAYVGSKAIPKLTKNKLGGKTGAGIGAIAGYWASGRKKV